MPNLRRCKTFSEIPMYIGMASASVRSTSTGISEAVRILSDGARHFSFYPTNGCGAAPGRFTLDRASGCARGADFPEKPSKNLFLWQEDLPEIILIEIVCLPFRE